MNVFPQATAPNRVYGWKANRKFYRYSFRSQRRPYYFYYRSLRQFCHRMVFAFRRSAQCQTDAAQLVTSLIIRTHFLAITRAIYFILNRFTSTALSALTFCNAQVFTRKGVSAMAMRGARVFRSRRFAAQNIYLVGNSFEMFRIYTPTIATKVVDHQPFWYWADAKKIAKAMSHYLFAVSTVNDGIAVRRNRWVFPAFVRFARSFKIPKATLEVEIFHAC